MIMNKIEITKLTAPIQHAEGPYWALEDKCLVFTDTFQATIYKIKTDRKPPICPDSFKLPKNESVGFVLKIKGKKDAWLVGGDRYIHELVWPDEGKVKLKQLRTIEEDKTQNQFNDGKADALGRVWAGTLKREIDLSVSEMGGSLYMFDHQLQEHEKLQNVSISNGLAWSKDNTRFFFIDSATRNVEEYQFNLETGSICDKRVIINIKDHGYPGIADGMTIDTDDNLWIALFGGHEILQVNPTSGKIMRKIKMPVTYVTSLAWGGPNYDILYATSSRLHLNDEQKKREPDAGCVFAVTGTSAKGLPPKEAIIQY